MKKVLVVDDTKNIRLLLTTCLEFEGYKVFTASDGVAALELFENEHPDLAFVDIKMPEMSGTEVLRRIRDRGITIPIIIMTAFATVKNAVECTKLGAVAYLQKPFTPEKIRALLNELLSPDSTCSSNINDLINNIKETIGDERFETAYLMLKKALSIDPSCAEIYYLIGLVNEKQGNNNQAKKFYAAAKQFEI